MKPMLAHIYEPRHWSDNQSIWVQPKLNGVRALYQDGHFQSRDELPWNPKVLAHLTEPLKAMFEPKVILDGELYVHGWPLQRINGAIQIARTEPREDTHLVEYWVFDCVNFQAEFVRRFGNVSRVINQLNHPKIRAVTTVQVPDKGWVDTFYAKTIGDGFEGIMYRLGLCPYTWPSMGRKISDKNNRTWHLLKRKDWQDDEFECIGIQEGEGKRAGMVGAFRCLLPAGSSSRDAGTLESFQTFYVGSGLTDAEAKHYFDNPPIGHKIKVKYLCLTTGGVPFNPTVEAVL